jgi:three-Cys-motif partner protein
MAAPTSVLWELDEHSAAKHAILRAYLDAWLPIMASRNPKLMLIDGFAGPGRYKGGEDGSPVVMVKALLEHAQRDRIEHREIAYLFIEEHAGRAAHLGEEVEKLKPLVPATVSLFPIHGEYSETMDRLLGGGTLPPTFVFIDPFGYADTKLRFTSRILDLPKCEVLIYFPTTFLARFVRRAGQEAAFDALYGDRRWLAAQELEGEPRKQLLHGLFRDVLNEHAIYVRSFEIVTAEGGGYHLFFASNHQLGLKKMKEAMWDVDPVAGLQFRDSTIGPQMVLFEPEPDTLPLKYALRERFGTEPFTIEQAEVFTATDTAFVEDRHLKKRTLAPAERAGDIEVKRPSESKRGYPPGTLLRFGE